MHKIDAQKIIATQLQISEEEAEIIVKKAEMGQEFINVGNLLWKKEDWGRFVINPL